jgi:hypothetical protein
MIIFRQLTLGTRIQFSHKVDGNFLIVQGTCWHFDPLKNKWIIKRLRFNTVKQLGGRACHLPNSILLGTNDVFKVINR